MSLAPADYDHDHSYSDYLDRIQARFAANAAAPGTVLFTTAQHDVSLFDIFLDGFPAAERQFHNCDTCRAFFKNYAGLVMLDPMGNQFSPFWSIDDVPDDYREPVALLLQHLSRSHVDGVFKTTESVWGHRTTHRGWSHFALTPPAHLVFRETPDTSVAAAIGKVAEEFAMTSLALRDFTTTHAEQVLKVAKSDQLYRGDIVLGPAQWFYDMSVARDTLQGRQRVNAQWLAVATAISGFARTRNTKVGTVLEDVVSGMSFESVAARFADKMDPAKHGHAQAAPSAGAIVAAEKLVADLGVAPSLDRRYPSLTELFPYMQWVPKHFAFAATPTPASGGVFANVKAKTPAAAAPAPALELPASVMTWEKFQRTILPSAQRIEALVPHTSDRFAALVTAANADAPPLLMWDRAEARNPVSWYYGAGIDGEFRRRVEAAGGQYENVDVRATLVWNNRNDLDLCMYGPRGEMIYFGDTRPAGSGGWLDIDRNRSGETETPVENIRWNRGDAAPGRYRVVVWNYRVWDAVAKSNPFSLELEVMGEKFQMSGDVPLHPTGTSYARDLCHFTLGEDRRLQGPVTFSTTLQGGAVVSASDWGVTPGQFVPVTGILNSPNLWGDQPMPHVGRHKFFLLDGCRDTKAGLGRGYFNEILRGDLRPARSVLEAHVNQSTIAGAETANVCGLGMTDQREWNLTLRVDGALFKIDRWD